MFRMLGRLGGKSKGNGGGVTPPDPTPDNALVTSQGDYFKTKDDEYVVVKTL